MGEPSFEEWIAQTDAEVAALRVDMADASERWVDVATPYYAAYWSAKAEEVVTQQSELSKAKGADGLTRLKGEVNNLVANAGAHLRSVVIEAGEVVWPHMAAPTNMRERIYCELGRQSGFRPYLNQSPRHDVPSPLHVAESVVRGLVAEPLVRHGFAFGHIQQVAFPTGGVPRYVLTAADGAWSDDMLREITAYADVHEAALSKLDELERLRRDKERSEAKSLWDQAG